MLNGDNSASIKMIEVKKFIQSKSLHILCLVESDLHGTISRQKRIHPLSTEGIHDELNIQGFKIILPKSWQVHGQARVMIFAKDELQVKIKDVGNQNADLPTITCEISLGKEKKTIVNFFYREFTGGISGLRDLNSQTERLTRQIKLWRGLCAGNKDVICLGDANLCALKWMEESYQHKELSEMVQNFLLETSCSQLVKQNTRSEIVRGGQVSKSCIYHCYTNVPEKISTMEVVSVGTSDHLGLVVKKFCRAEVTKPRTVKKRSYKSFCIEQFLNDVLESDINKTVTANNDLDEAANLFEEKFKFILDRHAPITVFQMRKNYIPYVKKETKLLMAERKVLKEEATRTGDMVLAMEAKKKDKEIKDAVIKDEKEYYELGFDDNAEVTIAWKKANELLGNIKNLSPTAIKHTKDNGEVEIVTNPQNLASMFNNFFREKVEKLRMKTDQPPKIQPVERLRCWLVKDQQLLRNLN